MSNNNRAFAIFELLLPGLLGAIILLLIPRHIQSFSSFLADSSSLPSLFPRIAAWIMITISAVKIIHYGITKKLDATKTKNVFRPRVLAGFGLLTGYVILIPLLGFVISTVLCMIAVIYLLDKIAWYKALIFSVIVSFVIWYAFVELLHIPLPSGIWI